MDKKLVGLAALACAGLASICCLGPLIVTALGLSGLGLAAGLAGYRTAFLLLTGAVLAAGFYLTYRKRQVACADGRCEFRSASPTAKAALWLITAGALAMATFPNWSARVLPGADAAVPAGAQILNLKIAGMDCAACVVSIEKSVKKVPGVYSVQVDFDRGLATVVADRQARPQAVVQAVQAAGYRATFVSEQANGKSKS